VAGSVSRPGVAAEGTVLGIKGSHFTLNNEPTFLLGASYYGGLGASEDSVRRDLDDLQRHGFNWLRVWATWASFGRDVSAVDAHGQPRQPFIDKLEWLVGECDRRGLIVDVTLARGRAVAGEVPAGRLTDLKSHEQALACLVARLKPHRNWYLDLANERDVGDERYVSTAELQSLRELVRQLDAPRLVTASFGGHDLSQEDVREALQVARVDFLSLHRPRNPESPAQTEARTRECLAWMKELGRVVPIMHQEPFRRGYTDWQPTADDFLTDLRGAVAGGAAGWCFHNGSQRSAPGEQPRRSFDLSSKRLLDQLDSEEQRVLSAAAAAVRTAAAP
jgi:hypothetical protein